MGISQLQLLLLKGVSLMFPRYLDSNNLQNLTAGVFSTLTSLTHLYVSMTHKCCCKKKTETLRHTRGGYHSPRDDFFRSFTSRSHFFSPCGNVSTIFPHYLTLYLHFDRISRISLFFWQNSFDFGFLEESVVFFFLLFHDHVRSSFPSIYAIFYFPMKIVKSNMADWINLRNVEPRPHV